MRRVLLALVIALLPASAFPSKPPPCRGAQHIPLIEKAVQKALNEADGAVRQAYVAFIDSLGPLDALEHVGRLPAAFAGRPRDYYLRPRENGWLRVVYGGAGSRIHDKSPTDPQTCTDEFLVVFAVPVASKWSVEVRYFLVTAEVDNRRSGPGEVVLQIAPR